MQSDRRSERALAAAAQVSSSISTMIGELIDHYRVLELVGRGAMGIVYKALDLNLERQVAIKVMSAEARSDPEFVERFRQEARMQGALNHPNVALLFDYFVHDGAPVAVMEFIDGESLEQLIRRRGAIPAHESIPIFKQALRGVAAAHRAGIIHRDLKPSNLMITRDDIVKVMDFGIAKRQGAPGTTKVTTSIGSPLYMAPEQILGRPVDCRTDVYALGITLYELMSGQRPFNPRGKAEYLVLYAHVNDLPEPPTVHCRTIPQPIADAVMRSLAKDPDARFQSVDDFMRALPDVAAPNAAAPRVEPRGTVALPRVGPTGTVAIPRAAPSDTVALEYSPSMSEESVATCEPSGTIVFEYGSSPRREAEESAAFDSSAGTVWQEVYPPHFAPSPPAAASPAAAAKVAPGATPVTVRLRHNSTPSSPTPSPGARGLRGALPAFMQRLRAGRLVIAAVLVATLVLGTLGHHVKRLHATPRAASPASSGSGFTHAQASTETQTPTSTEPTAPPPAVPRSGVEPAAAPSADVSTAAAVSETATPLATTTAAARQDLSGTWRGEYVDASGRRLLRVVSLSISRVQDDGGIEGTLQYEAASGDGECKLHPSGSTYSAGRQRLQLSPEGCSPRYPRELGVPLDFDGVSPHANTLKDGRIQAPTGEVIRVKLKRVSGV
jgi:serine/threonine-protein kinase